MKLKIKFPDGHRPWLDRLEQTNVFRFGQKSGSPYRNPTVLKVLAVLDHEKVRYDLIPEESVDKGAGAFHQWKSGSGASLLEG